MAGDQVPTRQGAFIQFWTTLYRNRSVAGRGGTWPVGRRAQRQAGATWRRHFIDAADVVTQILKVFYEEPAALEPDAFVWPAPPDAPRYYRLYLAGTDLDTLRIGLTALRPEAFLPALHALLQRWPHRWRVTAQGSVQPLLGEALPSVLEAPAETVALVGGPSETLPVDPAPLATADDQGRLPVLRRLLDAGCLVALREPAHHGYDWHLFAPEPLLERLEASLRAHHVSGVRRFLVPYQKARTEERFYFEQWMLDGPSRPDYIREI